MLYEQLPAPTDEEIDVYLASLMIKEYGDLLKISRTRSVAMPLPALVNMSLTMNIYCNDMNLT